MSGKRVIGSFGFFMVCMFLVLMRVYQVSAGPTLAQTADSQSTYLLEVTKTRGTIYDCNLIPLTGREKKAVAAVSPTKEAAAALTLKLPQESMTTVYQILTGGTPFLLTLPDDEISAEGIDVFWIDQRYSDDQIAANVIGYLDGSGKGVSRIEKAYDEELSEDPGEITVSYKVDAVKRVLPGEERKISDSSVKKNKGVVLTLDGSIQAKAEELAEKYLGKGAVVVTEVPDGQIRAMVSTPSYNPNDVGSALTQEDSPLLNRALAGYNMGSVFKLVSAAAALEFGISPELEFECVGGIEVSGDMFHCFDGIGHGVVDMADAVAKSCNTYFIHLMQQVPQSKFLEMAEKLGFGTSTELAPGLFSSAGMLPSEKSLEIPKALANFSFGQGDLLVTPLQTAGMINAIAAGGMYVEPYLVEGLVDEDLIYTEHYSRDSGVRVFSEQTAELLCQFMASCVENGTGQKGKPESGLAGAKTGTAQTGIQEDGREIERSWYAGFYPLENPKYVIVVLAEDNEQGNCAPVFQELCDWMAIQW